MWMNASSVSSLRFSKTKGEGIKQFGWNEYNADDYGSFRVEDESNGLVLSIRLLRQDNDIVFRIEGDTVESRSIPTNVSLFMFLIPPSPASCFSVKTPLSSHAGIVVKNAVYHE